MPGEPLLSFRSDQHVFSKFTKLLSRDCSLLSPVIVLFEAILTWIIETSQAMLRTAHLNSTKTVLNLLWVSLHGHAHKLTNTGIDSAKNIQNKKRFI